MHLDMDAYFASIEQKANPLLRNKPIIVTGTGRTVITTSSYEARKFGIKTGMTIPEARQLCPQVIIVIGNHQKYIDTTLRINNLLNEFTDRVEAFSIDEFFLDITGIKAPAATLANRIKERIKQEVGITCSIGIGPNKLLAKLGSDMDKPNGLVIIKPAEVPGLMAKLPVAKLCGIGDRLAEHLSRLNIHTCGDLGKTPESLLKRHFGVNGPRLRNMGLGLDDSPVRFAWETEPAKSVGHSYTLPRDTAKRDIVNAYLLMLSEAVSVRMRKAGLVGRTVHLVLRYSDFQTMGKQNTPGNVLKLGSEIYQAANRILELWYPFKKPVRLVGVSVSNMSADPGQARVFETDKRQEKLAETVMKINDKYGSATVKPGLVLLAERYGTANRCGLIGKYLINKHA